MILFLPADWVLFIIALSVGLEECTSLRHPNGKAACHKGLDNSPLVVEEDDPYAYVLFRFLFYAICGASALRCAASPCVSWRTRSNVKLGGMPVQDMI